MTTPPQTPRSELGLGAKRDASESEREDGGNVKKKRRVAPTLVGSGGARNGSTGASTGTETAP